MDGFHEPAVELESFPHEPEICDEDEDEADVGPTEVRTREHAIEEGR
jgi:hypothetical protein